jgi:hypothetical protein
MLVAPGIHALIPDKAMAFDFLFNQLRAFSPTLSAADLTTALANHFNVNHSIARSETSTITAAIKAALFHCDNLSGIRFLDHTGAPVSTAISEDPDSRPDGVAFFVFASTVPPASIDPRLSAISPFTIWFTLPLPQSDRTPGTDMAPPTTVATVGTPIPMTLEQQLATAIAASQNPGDREDDADTDDSTTVARLATLQSKVAAIMAQTASPRRLFPSLTTPGTFTSVSPKMARLLTPASMAGQLPTYLGSLDFLDNQATFDSTFPSPLPLEEDGSISTSLSTSSVTTRIDYFLRSCELDAFASILCLDYVGSTPPPAPK